MEALFIMVPITLLLSLGALTSVILAVKRGEYDDFETPALKIFDDGTESSKKIQTLKNNEIKTE